MPEKRRSFVAVVKAVSASVTGPSVHSSRADFLCVRSSPPRLGELSEACSQIQVVRRPFTFEK